VATEPSKKSRLAGAAGVITIVGALTIVVVAKHEGVRTSAYRDVVGVPTVCFGETRGVKMGDRYTLEQCKKMLNVRLLEFEAGMLKCLKNPAAIPNKVYIVLMSFSYNVGLGAACKSSVFRAVNAGDYRAACNRLPLWNKAGGRTVGGLVRRRAEERALCLEGVNEKL
jgi:lysozyme